MKLDVETLRTVPTAPPGAGPDLAFEPPPPDPGPPARPLFDTAVAEGPEVTPTERPAAKVMATTATIHLLLPIDSNRRTLGRSALDPTSASLEMPATGRSGVSLDRSTSLMMASSS
jgi:hypothetical protein